MRSRKYINIIMILLLIAPSLIILGVIPGFFHVARAEDAPSKTAVISAVNSTGFKLRKIIDNGSDNNKLVLIIIGDGYTAFQQEEFDKSARQLANGLIASVPYNEFARFINVYALNVVSEASGAGSFPSDSINNYFGSCFNYSFGIERLLAPLKISLVSEVLANTGVKYDNAILLVNSDKYGGSGGEFTTVSNSPYAVEMLVHEFAHSFASLTDEYFAHSSYLSDYINLTTETDASKAPWFNFIGIDGVGLYPLESASGYFIPHENCKMKTLSSPFCTVCRNAIRIKLCEQLLKPEQPLVTAQTASPSTVRVITDGFDVICTTYLINNNHYFKLRDIAMALSSTGKRFSVSWSESKSAISLYSGEPYVPAGGELTVLNASQRRVMPSASVVTLDNSVISLYAYSISDSNYFRLRDIAALLNFFVQWDESTRSVTVDTTRPYVFE